MLCSAGFFLLAPLAFRHAFGTAGRFQILSQSDGRVSLILSVRGGPPVKFTQIIGSRAIGFIGAASTAQASVQTATPEQAKICKSGSRAGKDARMCSANLPECQRRLHADKGELRTTGRSGVNERQRPPLLNRGWIQLRGHHWPPALRCRRLFLQAELGSNLP